MLFGGAANEPRTGTLNPRRQFYSGEWPGVQDGAQASGDPAGRSARRLRQVREHRTLAITIALSIFGLAWAAQRVQEVLANVGAGNSPVQLASIGLLLAVIGFLLSWYFGTDAELEAVETLGPGLLKFVPQSEVLLVMAAALGLGLLGIASVNAVAFACVLFGIKALELWSSWPLSNLVRQNIAAADKQDLPPQLRNGLAAVRRYYLERPWVQLTTIGTSTITVCIAVGAYCAASTNEQVYVAGTTAASILLIVAMVAQEATTWRWRRTYIRELEKTATDNP